MSASESVYYTRALIGFDQEPNFNHFNHCMSSVTLWLTESRLVDTRKLVCCPLISQLFSRQVAPGHKYGFWFAR